jgi:hypothetical protein
MGHGNAIATCSHWLNQWERFRLNIIRSRGDEALFACIFYLRDHIFAICRKKNHFSCFGNQFSLSPSGFVRSEWPNRSRPTHHHYCTFVTFFKTYHPFSLTCYDSMWWIVFSTQIVQNKTQGWDKLCVLSLFSFSSELCMDGIKLLFNCLDNAEIRYVNEIALRLRDAFTKTATIFRFNHHFVWQITVIHFKR